MPLMVLLHKTLHPRTKEKNHGEEVLSNQQVYSWSKNVNGFGITAVEAGRVSS